MGRVAALTMIVWLAVAVHPQPAQAHVSPGVISTSYLARISGFHPQVTGVSASVLDGDLKLRLDVAPPHVVTVLGLLGEPFLKIGPHGTFANPRSPTAASAGLLSAASAGADRWVRLSEDHAFAWHENRLRPQPVVRGSSRRVANWTVPLLVDGRHVSLSGSEFYAAQPDRLLWAVPAAVIIAAAVLLVRTPRLGLLHTVALSAMVLAVVSWTVSWMGVILYGRETPLWLAVAALYALSVAGIVAAVVSTPENRQSRMIAIGTVAVFAATFALPELGAFQRGYVLSALPAALARGSIVVAIGCGTAAAIASVPDTLRILHG